MIIPILQLEKLRLSGHSCGLQWSCPRPWREREGCLGPKFQVCLASEHLLIKITVDDVWPVAQSCQTLCYSMDCSLPGSYVRGISQARILEWIVIFFSRGPFLPRVRTRVVKILYHWTTWEHPSETGKGNQKVFSVSHISVFLHAPSWQKTNYISWDNDIFLIFYSSSIWIKLT